MSSNLGTIKATITAETAGFDRGVKSVMGGMSSMVGMASKAATAVAAVGVAATVASIKIAGDFESALVSAGAKAGATTGQMEAMREAALSASGASAFSAKGAADAMGFLAQAGFDVNEQISALPGVLNLASAGELELAEAADIASNVLSGFGMEIAETARINDVLVKAANSSNTSVRQLGSAMSYAAPSATGAGVALEETAAAIGKLSDAGIQGSRAGRSFNAILAQFGDVAGSLGTTLTATEIQSLGFAGSLEKLQGAGLNAGNAAEHFGREAGPALQALLNQGIGTIGELDIALQAAGGTAEEVAAKKIATLNGAMNVLMGNISNVAAEYGQNFVPAATDVADATATMSSIFFQSESALVEMEASMGLAEGTAAKITEALGQLKGSLTASKEETAVMIAVVEKFIQSGLLMTGVLLETGRAAKIAALSVHTYMLATDDSMRTATEAREHQRQLDQAFSDLGDTAMGVGQDMKALGKLSQSVGDVSAALQQDVTSLGRAWDEAGAKASNFATGAMTQIESVMGKVGDKIADIKRDQGMLSFLTGSTPVMNFTEEESAGVSAQAKQDDAATAAQQNKLKLLKMQLSVESEQNAIKKRQLQLALEAERIAQSDASHQEQTYQTMIAQVSAQNDIARMREKDLKSVKETAELTKFQLSQIEKMGASGGRQSAFDIDTDADQRRRAQQASRNQRNAAANMGMGVVGAAPGSTAQAEARFAQQMQSINSTADITPKERELEVMTAQKGLLTELNQIENQRIAATGEIAGNILSAAGASKELQAGMSGAFDVAQTLTSAMAGLTDPFTAALSILGVVTGFAATLFGGDDDKKTAKKRGDDPRDFAKMIAEEFGIVMKERDDGRIVIQNLDARGSLANRAAGREMRRMLTDEDGLTSGSGV